MLNRMRKFVIAFFFILIRGLLIAQNSTDSVIQILNRHTKDSTEIKALIWLGEQASKNEFKKAFYYYKKAIQLSLSIKDTKSMIAINNELGVLYLADGNYDSSLYFHRHALQLAKVEDDSVLMSSAYRGLGLNFLRQRKLDSARLNLDKALFISDLAQDYTGLAEAHIDLGNLLLDENNKVGALKEFIIAAKLQDSLVHNPVGACTALANIGNIQSELGNLDKALYYTHEAQKLAIIGKYDQGIGYASQLMGRIFRKQKKLDEALGEYNKALAVYKRIGEKRSMAETLNSIGNIYYDQGNFQQARKKYYEVLTIAKSIKNASLTIFAYSCLGYSYYELKDYGKAINYIDSSRLKALAIKDYYSVLDALNILSSINEDKGEYHQSLKYFREYAVLKDSLIIAENRIELEEVEAKYQNNKKLAEIKLLKADQNLNEVELSRQRTIQIGTVITLILVIIIAVVLVNRYRLISKTQRLAEMERIRNTISRDLHDDIGSTLSSINIMSQTALNQHYEDQKIHLGKINEHSAKMMEKMSDIVWSINPLNDSLEQLSLKMLEFAAEILEPKNISFKFNQNVPLDLILDAEKRKHIFLIFKEAINNTAKYSGGSEVAVSISSKNGKLNITIKDNGIGFDPEEVCHGNGLANMKSRARNIQGNLEYLSTLGKGTSIILEIDIT